MRVHGGDGLLMDIGDAVCSKVAICQHVIFMRAELRAGEGRWKPADACQPGHSFGGHR